MSTEKTTNYVSFIWKIANLLRGDYKEHEYGDVILPFTVLTRLDSVLVDTKTDVLAIRDQKGVPAEVKRIQSRELPAIRSGTPPGSRCTRSRTILTTWRATCAPTWRAFRGTPATC